jgi:hypothetical protein
MPHYLQHIHQFCSELQPTIDFWVEVLGAKFENFRKFGDVDGAVLDLNSVTKIFLKKVDGVPNDGTVRIGFDHPGVIVEDLDVVLEKTRNWPNSHVSKEPFMAGTNRCAFVTGPEGMLVEVMQPAA